jgi:Domain of Unknown Function (DUF1080)
MPKASSFRFLKKPTMLKKSVLLVALVIFSTQLSIAQKTISLFNGKDLTGWRVYGTEKWFVQKGELICESGPDKQYGYLATDEEYKDFELTVQFLQESNGNSGIFFHSSIEGTKISGWQAEVAPTGKHTGGIYESYGREWLIKPAAEKESVLKEGQWNTMKVIVKDHQVTTWLNGVQMITLEDDLIGAGTGQIALQIHEGGGVRVRWRGITIREL